MKMKTMPTVSDPPTFDDEDDDDDDIDEDEEEDASENALRSAEFIYFGTTYASMTTARSEDGDGRSPSPGDAVGDRRDAALIRRRRDPAPWPRARLAFRSTWVPSQQAPQCPPLCS